MPRIAEVVACNWYGFALDLVGPSRVVAVTSNYGSQIAGTGNFVGFPVVQSLQTGQFITILLDQIGESVKQLASVCGRHFTPGTGVESRPRSFYRPIDINRIRLRHSADFLTCCGVNS